jgi:two-component system, cell cycle response regulator
MIDRRGNTDRKLARLSETNARLRRQLAEQESFRRIAHQDALTGLWNRRHADERLAEEMGRAQSVAGYRFSLLVADVDDLKRINDRRGHAAGDQALKWVAGFLSHGLRSDDVCCRIGGDEFLLILPDCGDEECRRLVRRVRARWQADAQAHARAGGQAVTVSIGTASYPADGATPEVLCAVADAEMYEDKRRQSAARSRSAPEGGPEPSPSTTEVAPNAGAARQTSRSTA